MKHLARVKLGALYADPKYGSAFHLALTQGVVLSGDEADLPGFDAATAEFAGAVETYMPTVTLLAARAVPSVVDGGRTGDIEIAWSSRASKAGAGQGAGDHKVTQVLL